MTNKVTLDLFCARSLGFLSSYIPSLLELSKKGLLEITADVIIDYSKNDKIEELLFDLNINESARCKLSSFMTNIHGYFYKSSTQRFIEQHGYLEMHAVEIVRLMSSLGVGDHTLPSAIMLLNAHIAMDAFLTDAPCSFEHLLKKAYAEDTLPCARKAIADFLSSIDDYVQDGFLEQSPRFFEVYGNAQMNLQAVMPELKDCMYHPVAA